MTFCMEKIRKRRGRDKEKIRNVRFLMGFGIKIIKEFLEVENVMLKPKAG